MHRLRSLYVLAALVLVSACRPAPEGAPGAAYKAFAEAFDQRDLMSAWDLLSTPTQQLLTKQAQAVAAFRHETPPPDGREVAFSAPLQAHHKVSSIAVQNISGDHATLLVTDDAKGQQTIAMVRENGVWKVDLTGPIEEKSKT